MSDRHSALEGRKLTYIEGCYNATLIHSKAVSGYCKMARTQRDTDGYLYYEWLYLRLMADLDRYEVEIRAAAHQIGAEVGFRKDGQICHENNFTK